MEFRRHSSRKYGSAGGTKDAGTTVQCSPGDIPPGLRPFPTHRPPARRRGVRRDPHRELGLGSVRLYSPWHSPGRRLAGVRNEAMATRWCGRRASDTGVGGVFPARRAHLWRMYSRTAFAMARIQPGGCMSGPAVPSERCVSRGSRLAPERLAMKSRLHSSRPGPGARSPGRPAPIRQSTIRSISSTQRSAPVPASAKAAIASNTASEKPPTLRMSVRSCACVVA